MTGGQYRSTYAGTGRRSRSRSPHRRSRHYEDRDRSRSPSRDRSRRDRRERSPANGHYDSGRYSSSYDNRAPASARSFEDRAQHKEQMMQSVRESSQQDRRVYVGNLSYDVKWHHLKDFMRKG
ncbi:hypothetical protein KC322_g16663, partial [Hortaea werneckii]